MNGNKDLEIQAADQIKLTEPGQRDRKTIFKKFIKTISLFIAIVASVSTIIAFLFQIASQKTEITAQILSNDELTLYAPEAELNARFSYAGEDVSHLWKIRIRFMNSGNNTLIGMGNQKNIIGEDGLNFVFLDSVRILKIQEEDDNFEADIIKTDMDKFQIQFVQWRANEYINYCFYIASEKELNKNPLPKALRREIIDGDLRIEDLTKQRGVKQKYLIEYLPSALSLFGRIIGLAVLGVINVFALFLIFNEWSRYLAVKNWFKKYSDKFADYLNNMKPPPSDDNREIFLKEPWRLPDAYWQNFEGGKKCPDPDMFMKIKTGIVFTIVMILILFGEITLLFTFIRA